MCLQNIGIPTIVILNRVNCYEIAKVLLITIELGVKRDCNDWLPMEN